MNQLKILILTLVFILPIYCFGNMASPFFRGTISAQALTSKQIDVLSEDINIFLKKDGMAEFKIRYLISTPDSGYQIPLLFLAKDFFGNFSVRVDGRLVNIIEQSANKTISNERAEELFGNYLSKDSSHQYQIPVAWEKNEINYYDIRELKFFEIDLSSGEHTIEVSYLAEPWTDRSNWVKSYQTRYSLSPSKHWKSFGNITIRFFNESEFEQFNSNLSLPDSGDISSQAKWVLKNLNNDQINISFKPKISSFANFMIGIGPLGIALFGILISIIFFGIKIKNGIDKGLKTSSKWIGIGVGVATLLGLILFWFGYDWIDNSIGEHASRFHGYDLIFYMGFLLFAFPIFSFFILGVWTKIYIRKIKSKSKQPLSFKQPFID